MATMNTYTGNKIDPMNMTASDISIQDIAHALSLTCRGGGHVSYFFSVAQHSINCMNEAKARGWSACLSVARCQRGVYIRHNQTGKSAFVQLS